MTEEKQIQVDGTIDVDLDDVFQMIDDIGPSSKSKSDPRKEVIPKAPEMKVHCRPDKMEARLRIVMPDGPAIPITERQVKKLLSDNHIVFGIDDHSIRRIIAEGADAGFVDDVVARGREPVHGADARIKWIVPDPDKQPNTFVAAGKVLCQSTIPETGTDGKDVCGDAIAARPGAEPLLMAGHGVKHDRKNRMWAAELEGRVDLKENQISVEPLRDASFEIEIDPAGLFAALSITPSLGDGRALTADEIFAHIAQRKIGCVNRDLVKQLVSRASTGVSLQGQIIAECEPPQFELTVSENWMDASLKVTMPSESVSEITPATLKSLASDAIADTIAEDCIDKKLFVELLSQSKSSSKAERIIARGAEAIPGSPAKIEWMISNPAAGEKVIVAGGKQIAKYFPPLAGTPGKTVTGTTLPAAMGMDIDLVAGTGVRFDRSRRGIWADRSGLCRLHGRELSIFPYSDANFSIEIDRGGLAAYLNITPHEGEGNPISEDAVCAEIRRLKLGSVKQSVVKERIQSAINGHPVTGCVIAESEPPSVAIAIGLEKMKAILSIDMPKSPVRPIAADFLRNLVSEAVLEEDITVGVDRSAIDTLIRDAIKDGVAEGVIARGIKPASGDDGSIKWSVDENLEDEDAVVVVAGGKVVASLTPPTAGTPGKTVTGEEIPTSLGLTPQIPFSTGIKFDEARGWWHTTNPGRLRILNSYLTVTPHEDASASIHVTTDKLTASLTLIPKAGDGRDLTKSEVIALLNEEKIVNIDELQVEQLVARSQNGEEIDSEIIARGRPHIPGEDGRIEYFIPSGGKSRRGVPVLRPIEEGAVIARIHPATAGAHGIDVFGTEIAPPRTKDVKVDCGTGTELIDGELCATESGNVIVKSNLIEVRKVLEFSQDVTAAIGDVDFDGQIIIGGDVGDNVSIRSTSDIYIKKGVGAAQITAKGNVEVGIGIVGREKGAVAAKGSVTAQFVERCQVDAGDSIKIVKASLHANLSAGRTIEILQERGALVGGSAASGNFVRANIAGSESGTETSIIVGRNPFIERELQAIENQLRELRTALHGVVAALKETNDAIEATESPKLKMTLRELTRKKVLIPHEIKKLFAKRELLSRKLYAEGDCFVEIHDIAHPGVRMLLKDEELAIGSPVQFARFTPGNSGVEIRPIVA